MGSELCSLYREIPYIKVRYNEVWVYYTKFKFFDDIISDPSTITNLNVATPSQKCKHWWKSKANFISTVQFPFKHIFRWCHSLWSNCQSVYCSSQVSFKNIQMDKIGLKISFLPKSPEIWYNIHKGFRGNATEFTKKIKVF